MAIPTSNNNRRANTPDWLAGGGMEKLMCAMDWPKTPLDPVEEWPQSLKIAVQIMLNPRYPMFVWWGGGN